MRRYVGMRMCAGMTVYLQPHLPGNNTITDAGGVADYWFRGPKAIFFAASPLCVFKRDRECIS